MQLEQDNQRRNIDNESRTPLDNATREIVEDCSEAFWLLSR